VSKLQERVDFHSLTNIKWKGDRRRRTWNAQKQVNMDEPQLTGFLMRDCHEKCSFSIWDGTLTTKLRAYSLTTPSRTRYMSEDRPGNSQRENMHELNAEIEAWNGSMYMYM